MRERKSLQYELQEMAHVGDIKNHHTRSYTKQDIKEFATYCKAELGIYRVRDITDPQIAIQSYADRLVADGHYSPASIHRKLAGPCRALGVCMGDIAKPKRTQDAIIRGRRDGDPVGLQGDREMTQGKYARLVEFQQAVGLRRAELGHLRGADLVRDESGYLCVRVANGKGGKEQLQRILPDDVETVKNTFRGVAPQQAVFNRAEMSNHINLHGLRAEQSQKAYRYYADRLASDSSYGATLRQELMARYQAYQPTRDADTWMARNGNDTPYLLRGASRQRAIDTGKPVSYDRLALLAVSVLHLSHWRLDVTVTNYLLV